MDYSFVITEFDSDDVDNSTPVINGRTENWINLTDSTFFTHRIGSNITTKITEMSWNDNMQRIQSFIDREILRINEKILNDKTRLYEITYFLAFIKVGPNDVKNTQDDIKRNTDILNFLKSYIIKEK